MTILRLKVEEEKDDFKQALLNTREDRRQWTAVISHLCARSPFHLTKKAPQASETKKNFTPTFRLLLPVESQRRQTGRGSREHQTRTSSKVSF